MNIVNLLQELAAKDIRLWLETEDPEHQGQLRFSAPDGAMTGDIIATLKANKPQIIAFLAASSGQSQAALNIEPADRNAPLALSPAQQRLYFLQQLAPQSDAYHIFAAIELRGALDIAKLQQCINHIAERHEVLRSSIYTDKGKAFIQISDEANIALEQCEAADNFDQNAFLTEQLQRPFNLSQAPLCRVGLYNTKEANTHILSLCLHHMIGDGWSLGLILKELVTLYGAGLEAENLLPNLPIQYADYAAWVQSEHYLEQAEQEKAHWHQQLNGTPVLELPFDYKASTDRDEEGGQYNFSLTLEQSSAIQKNLKAQECTLFMYLLASYACLLHKLSGQNDFAIGSPVAGRMHSDLEAIIGCFVNTQAIRFEFSEEDTFSSLLQRCKSQCQQALDNQSLSFEEIVQHLDIERNIDISPIFQTLFVLQNTPLEKTSIQDLSITPLHSPNQDAQFPLALHAIEIDGQLQFNFNYQASRFKASSIERFAEFLQTVLTQVSDNAALPISEIDLLSDADKALWLDSQHGINATTKTYSNKSIIEQFETIASKQADKIAIQYESQGLSYQALDQKANQLARVLIDKGLSGQCIALFMERSLELSVSLLAIFKAGSYYLPIDTSLPEARISFMLEDSKAQALICNAAINCPSDSAQTLSWQDLSQGLHSQIDQQPNSKPENISPHPLFNIIYTSGSTGTPKGVQVKASGIENRLAWMQDQYPIDHSDTVLQKTPYSFDVSVWELFWPLIAGAKLVYAKPDGHKDPYYLKTLIDYAAISTLHFVPSMLGQFMQSVNQGELASLKRLFTSGEALLLTQAQAVSEKLAHVQLSNLYGPTEAAIDVSYYDCPQDFSQESHSQIPIGKPIANTQLYILNPAKQLQAVGVAGELYIGGANLAQGYLNRDALNAECFIDNPFYQAGQGALSQKLYKTGDKARLLEDGNIDYLGRLDHQVKLRGLRIELNEINHQLEQIDSIKAAQVLVQREVLVAYIELADPVDLSEPNPSTEEGLSPTLIDMFKATISNHLPAYMIPQQWLTIDQWPLSPNGKLNRKALPLPSREFNRQQAFVAPSSESEIVIANIWQQVLGIEKISVHDNFFELGGHSLTATQAFTLAQEHFEIEIPLREVFDKPSISEIAALIDMKLLEKKVFISQEEEQALEDDMDTFIL